MARWSWCWLGTALALVGLAWGGMGVQAAGAGEEELRSLFDGQSLAGWRGYRMEAVPPSWTLRDGELHNDGQGPDLVTVERFRNFELHFEWKSVANGNSGVLYRVTEEHAESYRSGLEYQLLDDPSYQEKTGPAQRTASIYGLYPARDKTLHPAGEYNTGKIVVQGNRIEHWLNDEKVAEATIDSPDWKRRLAASKFHDWPGFAATAEGHIALQAHGSETFFRNLKIRILPDATPASQP